MKISFGYHIVFRVVKCSIAVIQFSFSIRNFVFHKFFSLNLLGFAVGQKKGCNGQYRIYLNFHQIYSDLLIVFNIHSPTAPNNISRIK